MIGRPDVYIEDGRFVFDYKVAVTKPVDFIVMHFTVMKPEQFKLGDRVEVREEAWRADPWYRPGQRGEVVGFKMSGYVVVAFDGAEDLERYDPAIIAPGMLRKLNFLDDFTEQVDRE